jgi:hypothetical protein
MPGQARDTRHAASHSRQAAASPVTCWLLFFTPLTLHLYFLYPHTVGSANFEFGGIICAHFVVDYAFYFNYGLFSFVSLI